MRIKYPRTPHLVWSGHVTDDDIISDNLNIFDNEIVMTEKMDGENTTIYKDGLHARSLDGRSHWTQDWVRALQSTIAMDLPDNFRLCGENVFAKHSIGYKNLESFFYLFSIWENDTCLSWNETEEWAKLLNLVTVPVIFRGKWDDKPELIHELWIKDETKHEGYVIRNANSFSYSEFKNNTGKYVRNNHVTNSTHWKLDQIEKNELL